MPGIGKKTAERLLLELKGKLGDAVAAPASVDRRARRPTSCRRWSRSATATARRAATLKTLPADVEVSDGIKLALRALAK